MSDTPEPVPVVHGDKESASGGTPASASPQPVQNEPAPQLPATSNKTNTDAGPHGPTRRRIRVRKRRARSKPPSKLRRWLWISAGVLIALIAFVVGAWLVIAGP